MSTFFLPRAATSGVSPFFLGSAKFGFTPEERSAFTFPASPTRAASMRSLWSLLGTGAGAGAAARATEKATRTRAAGRTFMEAPSRKERV
jgi:hypothetical protein